MGKVDALEIEGRRLGEWVICIHCERCYQVGEFRKRRLQLSTLRRVILQMCPYDGCSGDTVLDADPWGDGRGRHPEYEEVPERGRVYPIN